MLGRPLLIEGRAGVGKTEIANVMARLMDTRLIRLQCYEGLDVTTALYEWNYPKQLLGIRLDEEVGERPNSARSRYSVGTSAGETIVVGADTAGQAARPPHR